MANLPGPQPDVQFCPCCKSELRNIPRGEMRSKGYKRKDGTVSPHTHTYECHMCKHRFGWDAMTTSYMPPKQFRPKGIVKDCLRSFGKFMLWVGGLWVVIGIVLVAYTELNDRGWIEHQAEMQMFFGRDDWIVGEFRNCSTYRDDRNMDCTATPRTNLSGMTTHTVPVTFHGRIDRTDQKFFTWKCQRNADSFTCWALD